MYQLRQTLAAVGFGVIFLFVGAIADGAIIVEYPIPAGTDYKNPSSVDDHVTASTLENHGHTSVSTGTESGYISGSVSQGNENDAISQNDYWDFTVTAEEDYALNLENLVVSLGGSSVDVEEFTASFFVRSDVDGFATTLPGSLTSISVPEDQGVAVNGTLSVDLTGAAFQNLGSVSFRIYVFDNATNSAQMPRIFDPTLTGAVVPEPSSWVLLAMAAMGLMGAGWRRYHQA